VANAPNPYAPPKAPSSDQPIGEGDLSLSQASVEYAGFAVRTGARIIDMLVLVVLGAVGGMVGGTIAGLLSVVGVLQAGWLHRSSGLSVGTFAFGTLAGIVYHTLCEGVGDASAGKALLGLRVKRESLGPTGVGPALARNLAYYIDSFFFGLVAYSSMSRSEKQQRLGDKWGHTVVVRVASLPTEARRGLGLGMALGMIAHIVVSAVSVIVRAF
jgi:uncharacterized RDD family membrane protein YckC